MGSTWYWYGSAPRDTNNTLPFAAFGGINVYSSTDLASWHYQGMAVSPTASGTLSNKLVAYNPRVLHNASTGKYDQPTAGRNGDHINESLSTISSSPRSPNYSELDYEYVPNGGWGAPGPRLDTTSWRSAKEGDRVTHALNEHLAGWHVVMLTAVNEVVTYSIDGRKVFSSDGKSYPRERMKVHLSAWLVDLPFTTQRTWDIRVNWLYYQSGQAVSVTDVQKTVDTFYAGGINYANSQHPVPVAITSPHTPQQPGGHRLAEQDPAQDQCEPADLLRGKALTGHRGTEQDTGDRVEQPDQADGTGPRWRSPVNQATKASAVATRVTYHVPEPDQRTSVHSGRCALDQYRGRREDQPTRDQLPGGERDDVHAAAPALGEHVAERGHHHRADRREYPRDVHRPAAPQQHQGDPGDAQRRARQLGQPRSLGQRGPGEQHHHHRRGRHDRRCHARRQRLRGQVDQREERAHVQGAEDQRPPPPGAVWQPAADEQEQQAGRQRRRAGSRPEAT